MAHGSADAEHRRPELTKLAASLYPDAQRVLGTTLITKTGWLLRAAGRAFIGSVELGR